MSKKPWVSVADKLADPEHALREERKVQAVLRKPAADRTRDDVRTLVRFTNEVKFFADLAPDIRKKVCTRMTYRQVDKGTLIITQGDVGDEFYIMISGSVAVCLRDNDNPLARVLVNLHKGAAFGELALVNDKPRAASIVALETVQLLVLNKSDYTSVLEEARNAKLNRRVRFLRKLACFSGWPASTLEAVAGILQQRTFRHNTVILKQGGISESLYFIEAGACRQLRMVHFREGPSKEVRLIEIGHLGPGDMFGQVTVTKARERRDSVVAQGKTTILELNPFDAQRYFSAGMKSSLAHMAQIAGQCSETELMEAYAETEEWENFKMWLLGDIIRAQQRAKQGTTPLIGRSEKPAREPPAAVPYRDVFDSVELQRPEPLRYRRLRQEHRKLTMSGANSAAAEPTPPHAEGGGARRRFSDLEDEADKPMMSARKASLAMNQSSLRRLSMRRIDSSGELGESPLTPTWSTNTSSTSSTKNMAGHTRRRRSSLKRHQAAIQRRKSQDFDAQLIAGLGT